MVMGNAAVIGNLDVAVKLALRGVLEIKQAAVIRGRGAAGYVEGRIDVVRAEDMVGLVANVVNSCQPILAELTLVAYIPLHHVSGPHVRRNRDVSPTDREYGRAGKRIAARISCIRI